MSFNLIIPVAADRSEYKLQKPYWMDAHPSGNLMLFETISGLNLQDFDKIYFALLKKHVEQYHFDELLIRQFENAGFIDKLKIVLLDKSTRNQPETVATTIEKENITGSIVIKDADNRFDCSLKPGNFVCTYPLDALKNVNPADKSYINIDDNSFVTNIVEKKIISRWFCSGAYGFEKSSIFLDYFKKHKKMDGLYISHLIYAMLLDKISIHPINITNYSDWANEIEWNNFKSLYRTIFIPLNLILQKNKVMIPAINKLFESGKTTIVIVQGKDNLSLSKLESEKTLKNIGLYYHHFLSNINLESFAYISKRNEILKLVNNL